MQLSGSSATRGGGALRVASDADVDQLATLINDAFVVEQVAIEGNRVDRTSVENYMRTGKFVMLEEDASLVGCMYLEKRGSRGYLGLLSVAPAQQNRGIGGSLTAEAERYFREEGCEAVDLRVISARAELLRFYEKLGYAVTGTSPMPGTVALKVPCHFIHMSKSLR